MGEIKAAIAYFEDAVRESDEIIADCSPDLQAELIEQKKHFEVALAALREKQERVACGECMKFQTSHCAARHEQALNDYCSHGERRKP